MQSSRVVALPDTQTGFWEALAAVGMPKESMLNLKNEVVTGTIGTWCLA